MTLFCVGGSIASRPAEIESFHPHHYPTRIVPVIVSKRSKRAGQRLVGRRHPMNDEEFHVSGAMHHKKDCTSIISLGLSSESCFRRCSANPKTDSYVSQFN